MYLTYRELNVLGIISIDEIEDWDGSSDRFDFSDSKTGSLVENESELLAQLGRCQGRTKSLSSA